MVSILYHACIGNQKIGRVRSWKYNCISRPHECLFDNRLLFHEISMPRYDHTEASTMSYTNLNSADADAKSRWTDQYSEIGLSKFWTPKTFYYLHCTICILSLYFFEVSTKRRWDIHNRNVDIEIILYVILIMYSRFRISLFQNKFT